MNIQIVRLKSGEDVVGGITKNADRSITLHDPMAVDMETYNNKLVVLMSHWLPTHIIKKNSVKIKNVDVLAVMAPNADFVEYYKNTISDMKTYKKTKEAVDGLSDEEYKSIMEAIESISNETIH
jgi:hypothetical protein